jgi:hypothetical protein
MRGAPPIVVPFLPWEPRLNFVYIAEFAESLSLRRDAALES